ncbi:MAG: DUF2189 domain-containing protein [Robiginitomaculum sp.]|nr:DUF2189 domain-containing protein [Robiginitomaculum sp.]MDQ7078295.1 DUF2189 domain-containing protein [Robiginitomaculum sp.]
MGDKKQASQQHTRHMERLTLRAPNMGSPMRWITAGWDDVLRHPVYSLGYGFFFTAGGLLMMYTLFRLGWAALIPAAAGGFIMLAPLLAVGLYGISRRDEEGKPLSLSVLFPRRFAEPKQLAYVALALMLAFIVWMQVALLLFALFSHGHTLALQDFTAFVLTTEAGLTMASIGAAIGLFISLVVFSISALSIPILLEHHVDAVTAISASVRMVIQHPGPMLVWAWLIALYTAFGLAFAFLGLVFVFPIMGHATWHAYREMVAPAEED